MRVLKIRKLQPFNKMTLIAKFKDLKLSSYSRSLYITWYSEQCGITALIKTIYDNIVRYLDSFFVWDVQGHIFSYFDLYTSG